MELAQIDIYDLNLQWELYCRDKENTKQNVEEQSVIIIDLF